MNRYHVFVETEPVMRTSDDLNRLMPMGGAFLLETRVEKEIWQKMKNAGAVYFSADDLEDFDMFDANPGWRYSLSAVGILLDEGKEVVVWERVVNTRADLEAMFMPDAVAAYKSDVARRQAEQAAAIEQHKSEQAAAQGRAGNDYLRWKAEHLAGLIYTSAHPDTVLEWTKTAFFDSDVPGTWYTTGDSWDSATVEDGTTYYRRSYGNAVCYYAPQAIVDRWCEAYYQEHVRLWGEIKAARWVLLYARKDVMWSDVARRLVELHGTEFYAIIARREPWPMDERWVVDKQLRKVYDEPGTAELYDIPVLRLAAVKLPDVMKLITAGITMPGGTRTGDRAVLLWRNGRTVYGKTYYDEYFVLTPEQEEAVLG